MQQIDSDSDCTTTLYYDGRCPLCMGEMDRLRRLKSDALALVDIHCVATAADLPDRHTLLRDLHLRLPDGTLLTGIAANVAAWQFTPYGHWFRWLHWPLVRRVTDRVYSRWARWRYERLYGQSCDTCGSC